MLDVLGRTKIKGYFHGENKFGLIQVIYSVLGD